MKLKTLLIALLLSLPLPALAAECVEPHFKIEVAAKSLSEQFPEAKIVGYQGDKARALLVALTALLGPPPDPSVNEVYVVHFNDPNYPLVNLAVAKDGCVLGTKRGMPIPAFEAVMRAAFGLGV